MGKWSALENKLGRANKWWTSVSKMVMWFNQIRCPQMTILLIIILFCATWKLKFHWSKSTMNSTNWSIHLKNWHSKKLRSLRITNQINWGTPRLTAHKTHSRMIKTQWWISRIKIGTIVCWFDKSYALLSLSFIAYGQRKPTRNWQRKSSQAQSRKRRQQQKRWKVRLQQEERGVTIVCSVGMQRSCARSRRSTKKNKNDPTLHPISSSIGFSHSFYLLRSRRIFFLIPLCAEDLK